MTAHHKNADSNDGSSNRADGEGSKRVSPLTAMRPSARDSRDSGITAIIDISRDKPDVIPLLSGEGHLSTPQFICEAAAKSLAAGDTFYTYQRGIPELRQALAEYHTRVYGNLFGKPFSSERFFVTGSGMMAIALAGQVAAGAGDEVIVPSPVWPNIINSLRIPGAIPVEITMTFAKHGWQLDLQKIRDAITPKTRALFINTPGNPTGWTPDIDMLREILQIARDVGIWIIADEVYSRYYYSAERAPSFYDIMEPDDHVIFANTISKNWAMTGWRVGWLSAPSEMAMPLENLIQNSTSGVAEFMQHGCVAAITKGEELFLEQRERSKRNRDILCKRLLQTGKVRLAVPDGAFYLMFAIDGITNSMEACVRMVDEARVGICPGSAFGPGGTEFFRICYLRDTDQIIEAAERIANWIEANT